MKIRFQNWVILMTALLVTMLVAVFLVTVYRTFTVISEDTALQRFNLIAQQAELKLAGLVRQSANLTNVLAGADRPAYARPDGSLNPTGLVRTLLGSVARDDDVYSHFVGLDNDEFLQVINVHGDARIADALKAPAGTAFVVRTITRDGPDHRTDHFQFLDHQRQPLGERSTDASLVPTQRPWYSGARARNGRFLTAPYTFGSTGELGITVATPMTDGGGVLGTDISLRSLQTYLSRIDLPPQGAMGVLDDQGHVLAFVGHGAPYTDLTVAPMTDSGTLTQALLAPLKEAAGAPPSAIRDMGAKGERFVVATQAVQVADGMTYRMVIWAPMTDFTAAFHSAQNDVLLLAGALLLVLLPLAYLGSHRVAQNLSSMAADSERIRNLDFSQQPHKNESILYELNTLADAMVVMHGAIQKKTSELQTSQDKLAHLVQTGISLSREQDRGKLLQQALEGARQITHATAATLFLKTERDTLAFAQRTSDDPLPSFEIPLFDEQGRPNSQFVAVHVTTSGQTEVIDDVYAETRFDLSGTKRFSEASGFRSVSLLTVPLSPHEGEVIGAIQLLNALDAEGHPIPFDRELIGYVEALAAQAAVAIENQNLIEAQKNLMDALIKLIAGAIDAKSPYTGGHCERVPELAIMLAKAATAQTEGPLASFHFDTEEQWREFRIGAWLHDCGKVTTPEYVVDKSVKLETLYNRIHEVRMRFEVLLRDARISALEAVAAGADPQTVQAQYEARQAQLSDDFAFLAECNLGGEFMAPEKMERLRHMAEQTWVRHFDDRLGLAHEELKRYTTPPEPLPATEHLLADKPQHVIPRTDLRSLDPKWGFKVNVPEHLYNYGELHNLSIGRGTLTDEERYKINEHIIQTILMLEALPLPASLKRVPEYAGTHHETLAGTGYPRKLTAEELSVPARIMAIADIFEALTASDRPYKKAKTLSESVKILSFFKKDGHIDGYLFDLFLTSGVYREYADRYLQPEQIDEVDLTGYVKG